MRRPKLASSRALRLDSVRVLSLSANGDLSLRFSRPARTAALNPGLETPAIVGFKPPPMPRDVSLRAALERPEVEDLAIETWPSPNFIGGTLGVAGEILGLTPLLQPPFRGGEGQPSGSPQPFLPYQERAITDLQENKATLYADEPGLQKTPVVLVALADLVQKREAKRTLLVSPASRHRHWLRVAARWTPGLAGVSLAESHSLGGRPWRDAGHLLLCEPQRLVRDFSRGQVASGESPFDLIILDAAHTLLHKNPNAVDAAIQLEAPRRWALAGGLPDQEEDWRLLFAFLTPDESLGSDPSLDDMKRRLGGYILMRRKAELLDEIPPRMRREYWLELSDQQEQAYHEALANERHSLRQLGGSVSRTHIESALGELNRATAFAQGSLDGVKIRALAQSLEDIRAVGDKMVLFSRYFHRGLEPLQQALQGFGAVVLSETAGASEREQILRTFRRDPKRRVLIAHLEAPSDGKPLPASHVLHFDVDWNPARRIRAEQRFFPELKPEVPLTVTEFWVAGTHDERLHELLAERELLPSDLPQGTQPSDLERRITVQDWLDRVLEASDDTRRTTPIRATTGGTDVLASTSELRSELESLSDEEILNALGAMMGALGFPTCEQIEVDDFEGLSMAASPANEHPGDVLVHLMRTESRVGVARGRELLETVDEDEDFVAGYLVALSDFTSACKNLAEKSEGRLSLLSGTEFFRHLRILGWL